MVFQDRYGPWAIVAGSSAGLGAAFAVQAASRGLNVVLVARRGNLLRETADDLKDRFGVEVRSLEVDLGRADAVKLVTESVESLEIGLIIYNAAAEPQGYFLDIPTDELDLNISVNCTTPTGLLHALVPKMVQRERGGAVLVSSMGALQGIAVFAAYGAAKAYELILAEGLWDEVRRYGVDAFAYVVGATATPTYIKNSEKLTAASADLVAAIAEAGQAVAHPRSCEEVASALFAVLDGDRAKIGPRHYSHPDDQARALHDATRDRAVVVAEMGRMTTAAWA